MIEGLRARQHLGFDICTNKDQSSLNFIRTQAQIIVTGWNNTVTNISREIGRPYMLLSSVQLEKRSQMKHLDTILVIFNRKSCIRRLSSSPLQYNHHPPPPPPRHPHHHLHHLAVATGRTRESAERKEIC